MRPARLTIVGDALLDRDVDGTVGRLAPDAPVPVVDHARTVVRPGGAGLAAMLAAAAGHEVRLVTALAPDGPGAELRTALKQGGVKVVDLVLSGETPEKIRIRAQGRALLRLDRGGAPGVVGPATAAARATIEWSDAVLVADYGRGVCAEPGLRAALEHAVATGTPLVWDPHPRGGAPIPGVWLVTPNAIEAAAFAARPDAQAADAPIVRAGADADTLRDRWTARWVCVTRGADGAVLAGPDGPLTAVPAECVPLGDPCGAGDRFAVRATEVLAAGGSAPEAVRAAVASASAFVAAGGAASVCFPAATDSSPGRFATTDPMHDRSATTDPIDLVARVRARGGTVVVTGGCFDLLHPGHIQTLQSARALGDCLVVCLNSDRSVRRLKGPTRPVVAGEDRAAVLSALSCVDAVVVFEEDTPARVLRELRPDVWVKGGDYAAADLPEAEVLAEWGGRAIVLPFVEGRSTTRLIEEAQLYAV
jgi:rfaE bifunctional protein nucleotidyltransferase chain/domain/rfaE bifunctional protein kinase chain/domain